ncbi:MAG: hypothetical protein R8G60_01980 [Roseovarius pacificus]|nr:hypothetical protein [Roseovarius pacificus]
MTKLHQSDADKQSVPDLPYMPSPDASPEELYECLGDLLAWALNQRLGQFMAAGFSAHQMMNIRSMAVRFQKGAIHLRDLEALRRMLPRFEKVHITKGVESTK